MKDVVSELDPREIIQCSLSSEDSSNVLLRRGSVVRDHQGVPLSRTVWLDHYEWVICIPKQNLISSIRLSGWLPDRFIGTSSTVKTCLPLTYFNVICLYDIEISKILTTAKLVAVVDWGAYYAYLEIGIQFSLSR